MVDKEILASEVDAIAFPFPSEGNITVAVRNTKFALGPVMLHIMMPPGSLIPAHAHEHLAEAMYVVDGELINEDKAYRPGTSLHFKVGHVHGPQRTNTGATLLVMWTDAAATQDANIGDFVVAQPA
jgi:quercetin dioxygenase-like cupin family protein